MTGLEFPGRLFKKGGYMKKRVYEISVLNVLFALLVIFIHVSSNPVTILDKTELSYMAVMTFWRLSSFVVQGFIFLSGFKMFFNRKDKFEPLKFYIGKVKNIILPYIIWVVIFYFYFKIRGFLPEQNDFFAIVRHIFMGDLAGHFYFVPVIVQFYILAPVWNILEKKVKPAISVAVSLVVMLTLTALLKNFRYTDRIFTTYLFYFVAGIYAGANYDKFVALIKKHFGVVAGFFVIAAISNSILTYVSFAGIKHIAFLEYVHIAYCILAIFFCFGVALKLNRIAENKLVKNIDRASYYIYLAHPLFIYVIDHIMYMKDIASVRYTYPIRTAFVYLVTLILCIGYTKIKSRYKR